ncbi:FmdE family protein [Syntrophomonas erecta]
MRKDMPLLKKAIEFHGHVCPGLLMGVRAAEFALDYLQLKPDRDEELLAVVETDSCGVDAIQAILSCTFGKGNLFFRDYGKNVYTIASRTSNRAVRIAQKFKGLDIPAFQRFRELKDRQDLTESEEKELEILLDEIIATIMNSPLDNIFHWQDVPVPELERAHIEKTVQCTKCGEGVMLSRAINTDKGLVCGECQLRKRV